MSSGSGSLVATEDRRRLGARRVATEGSRDETTTRHRGDGGLRRRWLRRIKHRIDADRDRQRNGADRVADGGFYRSSDRSTYRGTDGSSHRATYRPTYSTTDRATHCTAEPLRCAAESLGVQLLRRWLHLRGSVELLRLLQLHSVVLAIHEWIRRTVR
jgi:hypothetical protein